MVQLRLLLRLFGLVLIVLLFDHVLHLFALALFGEHPLVGLLVCQVVKKLIDVHSQLG